MGVATGCGCKEVYRFPLLTPLVSVLFCTVQSMDDNYGEWVECMGVASSGCGEQEAGVASGSVWLLGVVVRRYIDFLILLIPTHFVSVLFTAASLPFVHFKNVFRSC